MALVILSFLHKETNSVFIDVTVLHSNTAQDKGPFVISYIVKKIQDSSTPEISPDVLERSATGLLFVFAVYAAKIYQYRNFVFTFRIKHRPKMHTRKGTNFSKFQNASDFKHCQQYERFIAQQRSIQGYCYKAFILRAVLINQEKGFSFELFF